jgi:hypothetical protein
MQILDFINLTSLKSKTQSEQAVLLCYYLYKENKQNMFAMNDISEIMINAGLNQPILHV